MTTLKKLGKALMAVGIFMMLAAPAMAGNGKGPAYSPCDEDPILTCECAITNPDDCWCN